MPPIKQVVFNGGLSNTSDLSPTGEGHEQPDTPEVSSRETRLELWLLWGAKCRQTDSIESDGDGLPRLESIGLFRKSVRERLGNYLSRYSSGCGLHRIRWTTSNVQEKVEDISVY